MGNCLGRCFGISDKRRKFLRTRYNVERDISIEFENLMDDDNNEDEMTRLVTEKEKQLLLNKSYTDIVKHQKILDAEIDSKLRQEEEEIRAEEEKFYEAKREAARVAKFQKAKETTAKNKTASRSGKSWLGDDETEWEIAGGEDDFDMFLESVRARSLRKTHLNHGSTDGHSSTSSLSGTQTKDKSSSIDLEWEHEEGVVPQKRQRSSTEENLYATIGTRNKESPAQSVELEWDNDFVSADCDTEKLLTSDKRSRNDS
ncbi:AP-1 complex-associated regulatory protein-like [Mytilus californianus]|uniref:AP-1 complex-associated regulatory protein-like n=1 Tax=Mytilus californianus TaxID=6549 RepID=UPI002245E0C8|nr:AP-1 complex-associated regulatory protein-like [Mytilus californianus]